MSPRKRQSPDKDVAKAGIAEVEGMFCMIAADSEIADDALPRFTTCPICGGEVSFAPLSVLDIPRVKFTSDTTWGRCREEWQDHARSYYKKYTETWTPIGQQLAELQARPYALILECCQCGKGFDPRSEVGR